MSCCSSSCAVSEATDSLLRCPQRQPLRSVGWWCVLGVVLLATAGCRKRVDDAEKIRVLVRDAARAASERDLEGVLAPVAEDFGGQIGFDVDDSGGGGLGRKELRMLLFRFLRQGAAPRVVLRSIEVQVQGDRASTEVLALVARGVGELKQLTEAVPGQAEAMKLELQLVKRDGDWKVVGAKRTPVDPRTLILAQ
ncbi:MAG: hypothetical protein ABIJ09_06975 [Pseudomonadota bacterium]